MAQHKPIYAFLGPEGTFSDQAVRTFVSKGKLASEYEPLPCDSMSDVFEAVDRGKADYGVVPIENSLEGPVTTVLDAFAFTTRAEILGEVALDIHQSLILAKGATLDDVTTIASHPQGIGQCRRWLNRHLPDRQLRLADSTAAAVAMAVEDASVAAVGSALAAELMGADVYEEAIEDNLSSQTRFVLIGRGPVAHDGPGKSTLALFIQSDRAGVLQIDLVRVHVRGHQPDDDPVASYQARAGRLHVLHGHRRLRGRPGHRHRAQLPAHEAARGADYRFVSPRGLSSCNRCSILSA